MRTMDFYQRDGRLATAYAVFITCWRMLEIAGSTQMTAMCFPESACAASEMQPPASDDLPQSMGPRTATLPEVKSASGQKGPHLCLWVREPQVCIYRVHPNRRHHQPKDGRCMPLILHRGPIMPVRIDFNWHLIFPPRPDKSSANRDIEF